MLICVACIFTPGGYNGRRGEAHAFREHKASARRVRHEPGGAGSKAGGSAANRKQMGARCVTQLKIRSPRLWFTNLRHMGA